MEKADALLLTEHRCEHRIYVVPGVCETEQTPTVFVHKLLDGWCHVGQCLRGISTEDSGQRIRMLNSVEKGPPSDRAGETGQKTEQNQMCCCSEDAESRKTEERTWNECACRCDGKADAPPHRRGSRSHRTYPLP